MSRDARWLSWSARTGPRRLQPVAGRIAGMGDFLRAELAAGGSYLPAGDSVLRAFSRPLADVRVLIVGQDPYPTPGHPVGLSFSVAPECGRSPRSLQNIYAELQADLGIDRRRHGDLTPWFDQGVLLLNRVLTVQPGRSGSHRGKGWEQVTQRAIEALVARGGPLVAILWGRDAQSLMPMLGAGPLPGLRAPVAAVGPLRLLRLAPVQPRQRPLLGRRRADRAGAPATPGSRHSGRLGGASHPPGCAQPGEAIHDGASPAAGQPSSRGSEAGRLDSARPSSPEATRRVSRGRASRSAIRSSASSMPTLSRTRSPGHLQRGAGRPRRGSSGPGARSATRRRRGTRPG